MSRTLSRAIAITLSLADHVAELNAVLDDPSPANVAALRAKHAPAKRKAKAAR